MTFPYMTPERAKYILANTQLGGDFRMGFKRKCNVSTFVPDPTGITEEEHAYILKVWDTIPSGSSTYSDAVRQIARGDHVKTADRPKAQTLDIHTTARELFTGEESARLARLIHKRFGRDTASATAAYNRLMQGNISEAQFGELCSLAFPEPQTYRCPHCLAPYVKDHGHSCGEG